MTNTPAENRTALSEQLASGLAPLVIDESVLQAAFAAHQLGDIEQAARGYLAVLEKNPDHFDAIHLLGVIEYQRGNLTAALPLLRRAMAIPGHQSAEVFFNGGLVLQALGMHQEAVICYERAIVIRPGHAPAHYNRGFSLLLLGDFARGWAEYEWRLVATDGTKSIPRFIEPKWLGTPTSLTGKTIFLHAEQGLGDVIQFVRYVRYVAQLGAKILLGIPTSLAALLGQLSGVDQIVVDHQPVPAFDYYCPLMSLPLALQNSLPLPLSEPFYLKSDAGFVAAWALRLGEKKYPRIGVVCSGDTKTANDQNRSIALEKLVPLLSFPAHYVCLQKEMRAADKITLAQHPEIYFAGDQLVDFMDTAAIIELTDIIITVDTCVAHLAGAMGKPVWLLLPYAPDWRWQLDSMQTVWYPSMRLFRQAAPGDWGGVIQNVRRELTLVTSDFS